MDTLLDIQNITHHSDLLKLSKNQLVEICTDMNLPTDGYRPELAFTIWEKIKGNTELQNEKLKAWKTRLLCGRTSVMWYQLDVGTSKGIKETLIKQCGFNPFNYIKMPPKEELTSTPILISAANGDTESEYFLRFIYKSGVTKNIYGDEMQLIPSSSIVTVYVNEELNCFEVRSEPGTASKVARSFARLINREIALTPRNILVPFGNNVEAMADALEGNLIEALSKPESLLEDFTAEQTEAIAKVLTAFDEYLAAEDVDSLTKELKDAKIAFGGEMLSVPFAALILSGIEKVSLGVAGRDLRELVLYDFLKPYLQHQGGFIQFVVSDEGLPQSYTIKVGLKSNSVYFVTPATENVLKFVRERIF
ncbi:hypothetical protein [Sporomusa sphaeroides]|uniref:SAP domain protein n=1 Tax=Sporomusa sphaeroides DSM 2875 TaxID=1337886 RepID=A0ABP2CDM0_9FIRM|nr:hypothetical protein [Sporomusa sphaeroides]OLS54964.1 hypothetical protein SPSPH_37010 [Sporomusa sphaeroides DSM 2875]CVK21916.1 hypothetical protein SSPH_04637 [Sporomusa sphaeroides DSM 2875]